VVIADAATEAIDKPWLGVDCGVEDGPRSDAASAAPATG
jgi:hypothetical protein